MASNDKNSCSQFAVRSNRSSFSIGPINWTPTGKPFFPTRSGSVIQGNPASVQRVEKIGSPVPWEKRGACPTAEGAIIASNSRKNSSKKS